MLVPHVLVKLLSNNCLFNNNILKCELTKISVCYVKYTL